MATIIPGLGPQDDIGDSNFSQKPANQRGDLPDSGVNVQPLRPEAQPLDTYFKPPGYTQMGQQAEQNANRVAESLSAFQPALANYSTTTAMLQHQQTQSALGAISNLPPDQQAAAIQNNPALQGIPAQRLSATFLGNSLGNRAGTDLWTQFNDPNVFDKNHGNLDQLVDNYVQGVYKQYPSMANNQFFQSGLNDAIKPIRERLQQQQAEFISGNAQQVRQDSVGQHFSTLFEQSLNFKGTPQEQAAQFWNGYSTTGQTLSQFTAMPWSEKQKAVNDALQRAGDQVALGGDYDQRAQLISAITNFQRPADATGYPGGALANGSVGGSASLIATRAEEQADQRAAASDTQGLAHLHMLAIQGDQNFPQSFQDYLAKNPRANRNPAQWQNLQYDYDHAVLFNKGNLAAQQANQQADQNLQAARQNAEHAVLNGSGDSIQPYQDSRLVHKDGIWQPEQKEVPAEKLKSDALNAQDAAIQQSPSLSPQQKFDQQTKLWVTNSTDNPTWKSQLNGGYTGLSTMTQGGKPSQAQQDAVDLYQQLYAKSPQYVASMLKDGQAGQYYRFVQGAMTNGMDKASAMQVAAKTMAGPKPTEFDLGSQFKSNQELETYIRGKLTVPSIGNLWQSKDLTGPGSQEVVNRIKDEALLLNKGTGVDAKTAIDTAASNITSQYDNVNGSVVNRGAVQTPPYFPDAATKILQNYYANNKAVMDAEHMSAGDLRIQQLNGTQQWGIFLKNGLPASGIGNSFGLQDITAAKAQMDKERLNQIQQQQEGQPGQVKFGPDPTLKAISEGTARGVKAFQQGAAAAPDPGLQGRQRLNSALNPQ